MVKHQYIMPIQRLCLYLIYLQKDVSLLQILSHDIWSVDALDRQRCFGKVLDFQIYVLELLFFNFYIYFYFCINSLHIVGITFVPQGHKTLKYQITEANVCALDHVIWDSYKIISALRNNTLRKKEKKTNAKASIIHQNSV